MTIGGEISIKFKSCLHQRSDVLYFVLINFIFISVQDLNKEPLEARMNSWQQERNHKEKQEVEVDNRIITFYCKKGSKK